MQVSEDVEWISVTEASKRFGLSRTAIYDAIDKGIIGSQWRELGQPKRLVDAKEIERKMRPRPFTEQS